MELSFKITDNWTLGIDPNLLLMPHEIFVANLEKTKFEIFKLVGHLDDYQRLRDKLLTARRNALLADKGLLHQQQEQVKENFEDA
jgi:hypothetical protein